MAEERDTLCLKAQQWHSAFKQRHHHGWGASARPYVVGEDASGELLFCLRDERGRPVHEGDCAFAPPPGGTLTPPG